MISPRLGSALEKVMKDYRFSIDEAYQSLTDSEKIFEARVGAKLLALVPKCIADLLLDDAKR